MKNSTTKEFKDGKELTRTIIHPSGRKDVYITDWQGRSFVSRFSRNNSFQGTVSLNPPIALKL